VDHPGVVRRRVHRPASGYPELKFVVPDEGVMFWHDNMMIPVGAENPLDALTYMNYVYDPRSPR
jgi:spermidine/putrescine transport system substrate-binding protein